MGLATGLAIAGLAVSAAGTTKSFVEAGKARRDAQDASDKATKAFEEAEKKLEVNYLKGDYSKAKKILDWEPEISFKDLVNEMIKKDLKKIK